MHRSIDNPSPHADGSATVNTGDCDSINDSGVFVDNDPNHPVTSDDVEVSPNGANGAIVYTPVGSLTPTIAYVGDWAGQQVTVSGQTPAIPTDVNAIPTTLPGQINGNLGRVIQIQERQERPCALSGAWAGLKAGGRDLIGEPPGASAAGDVQDTLKDKNFQRAAAGAAIQTANAAKGPPMMSSCTAGPRGRPRK